MSRKSSVLMMFVLALALTACNSKEGAPGDKSKVDAKPAAKSDTGAVKVTTKVVLNKDIEAQVTGIASNCEVNVRGAYVTGCKNNESSKFNEFVREKKPKDAFETLTEMASGTYEKLAAAALSLLDSSMSYFDRPLKKDNASEAAYQRVLTLLGKAEDQQAVKLAVPATYIATLRGQHAALLKVVDGHKNNWVRVHAYKNLMTFSRMQVFDAVKAGASKGPADLTVALLGAPLNMYESTAEEKAGFCPWAKGYLGNADHKIVAAASYVMNRCRGEYIDAWLDEIEKRHKNGELKDRTLVSPMREMCFSMMSGVIDKAAVEKQCDRNYALMEKLTNDETLPGAVRGNALSNIGYQRRDKTSLDLMRKYENNKEPEVQKTAKEYIKMLVESYKLK